MAYYSKLKRNELSSHKKTWRNLKWVSLSKRNQSAKATYCLTTRHSGKGKTMETRKRLMVARYGVIEGITG